MSSLKSPNAHLDLVQTLPNNETAADGPYGLEFRRRGPGGIDPRRFCDNEPFLIGCTMNYDEMHRRAADWQLEARRGTFNMRAVYGRIADVYRQRAAALLDRPPIPSVETPPLRRPGANGSGGLFQAATPVRGYWRRSP